MRCEVAASLLHKPKLLLLDEPSIGLDVVAKQHIRDAIRDMNQLENVGVLLTSHDAGDLEALCKRVIIINHGQIVYQDKVSTLKRPFLTCKLVEVRYAEQVAADFQIEAHETLKVGKDRYGVKLRFDTRHTPVAAVLARLIGGREPGRYHHLRPAAGRSHRAHLQPKRTRRRAEK